jgi:hypothetical protein
LEHPAANHPRDIADFGVSQSVRSVEGEAGPGEEAAEDAVPVLQRFESSAEQCLQFGKGAAARLATLRLMCAHRPSTGFSSGAYPGSRTTVSHSRSATRAFIALEMWVLSRSHTTISGALSSWWAPSSLQPAGNPLQTGRVERPGTVGLVPGAGA